MNFGQAIDSLKAGKKVSRQGSNGKDMWLVLDSGTKNVTPRKGSVYSNAGITDLTIKPHIDMKTATGEMQPGWLASQADMLAEDWEEVA